MSSTSNFLSFDPTSQCTNSLSLHSHSCPQTFCTSLLNPPKSHNQTCTPPAKLSPINRLLKLLCLARALLLSTHLSKNRYGNYPKTIYSGLRSYLINLSTHGETWTTCLACHPFLLELSGSKKSITSLKRKYLQKKQKYNF